LAPGVVIDTSPYSKLTHWKQTMFPFLQRIECKSGEELTVNVVVDSKPENHRALDIHFKVSDIHSQVLMDQWYEIA
jgi:hypothetical protein